MANIKKIVEFIDGLFTYMKNEGWVELSGTDKIKAFQRYNPNGDKPNQKERVLQKNKISLFFTDRNHSAGKWYLILLDKNFNNKANYNIENMEFHDDGTISWDAGAKVKTQSTKGWKETHQKILNTSTSSFNHISASKIYPSLNSLYTAVVNAIADPMTSDLENPYNKYYQTP